MVNNTAGFLLKSPTSNSGSCCWSHLSKARSSERGFDSPPLFERQIHVLTTIIRSFLVFKHHLPSSTTTHLWVFPPRSPKCVCCEQRCPMSASALRDVQRFNVRLLSCLQEHRPDSPSSGKRDQCGSRSNQSSPPHQVLFSHLPLHSQLQVFLSLDKNPYYFTFY